LSLHLFLRDNACRRNPGKGCRNSFAGLVMLPGLEVWTLCRASCGKRPGSKRFRAQSDSRHPLPGPRRHAWGGAGRGWEWQMSGVQGTRPLHPGGIFFGGSAQICLRWRWKAV